MRAIAVAILLATSACAASAAEPMITAPVPTQDETAKTTAQTAVFAGGCFWGLEGVFERLKGVTSVRSGYAGGSRADASYNRVGMGSTGHAEAVEILYDPSKISYGTLMRIYFSVAHNPTQLNRQGPDTGRQYRSTIFAQSPEQETLARAYISELNAAKSWGKPLVTTIESAKPFYVAEAYHQDYLRAHPDQPYIVYNDLPKVAGLKRLFPALWSPKPAP